MIPRETEEQATAVVWFHFHTQRSGFFILHHFAIKQCSMIKDYDSSNIHNIVYTRQFMSEGSSHVWRIIVRIFAIGCHNQFPQTPEILYRTCF